MTTDTINLKSFDFQDLFLFDLANNHQGSVEHGLSIVRAIGKIVQKEKIRGAIKFQFRQLDSFIHPSHKIGSKNKHIPRFLSTRLETKQFQILLQAVRNEGLLAVCTPFDEESVDLAAGMGFDALKVASCSAMDWPLLEKIAESCHPIIFSTGGLQINQIDDLASFFEHRACEFAMMHCVSIYPIPENDFQLNQIDVLKKRYPGKTVGWSTHENPDEIAPVQIAVAKGARMFERHVGIATQDIKLNAYSATPEQVNRWIAAWKQAVELCGSAERKINSVEQESLESLRRGVYVREEIKKGQSISRKQVYFAMPYVEGQLKSGNWSDKIVAADDIKINTPVLVEGVVIAHDPYYQILKDSVHEVKAQLNEARIALNSEFEVEYSHHYGISRFREYGAVIINCINREYCKKILVQLPGQKHPMHYHPLKEETFQVLHGDLTANVDGHIRVLVPGDVCLVMPGVWHSFSTDGGCVFEEVSTTHFNTDSVYKDSKINKLQRHERKTVVDHWGRFQLPIRSESIDGK